MRSRLPVEWTPEKEAEPITTKNENSARVQPEKKSSTELKVRLPQLLERQEIQPRHWGINE